MNTVKFKNKYLIESTRLENYDYSQNGYYFITICAKDRKNSFGEILNNTLTDLQYTKTGNIAIQCWMAIPAHFPFVILDEFIIMPNHVHGIIIISKSIVETLHATSLPMERQQQYKGTNKQLSTISPQQYSLASVIRSYKSAVSNQTKKLQINFAWQTRFYERIIRDERELNTVRQYIIDNPKNWEIDELYL